MKITLEQIRRQQQLVAELRHKENLANTAYTLASQAKNAASTAQNNAASARCCAEEVLGNMGRNFANDLSETNYTPPMTENDKV